MDHGQKSGRVNDICQTLTMGLTSHKTEAPPSPDFTRQIHQLNSQPNNQIDGCTDVATLTTQH